MPADRAVGAESTEAGVLGEASRRHRAARFRDRTNRAARHVLLVVPRGPSAVIGGGPVRSRICADPAAGGRTDDSRYARFAGSFDPSRIVLGLDARLRRPRLERRECRAHQSHPRHPDHRAVIANVLRRSRIGASLRSPIYPRPRTAASRRNC